MQSHFCSNERMWLDFEDRCNWCDLTEEEAAIQNTLNANEKRQKLAEKKTHTLSDYIKDIKNKEINT